VCYSVCWRRRRYDTLRATLLAGGAGGYAMYPTLYAEGCGGYALFMELLEVSEVLDVMRGMLCTLRRVGCVCGRCWTWWTCRR